MVEKGGTKRLIKPLFLFILENDVVPGGGIEPPTRGFSITLTIMKTYI